MAKTPEKLEDVINQFCAGWARTNKRPDMGDKTIRSMFSVKLARQIRKYAKVVRRTTKPDRSDITDTWGNVSRKM